LDVAAFYATFDERVRAIVAHAYAHAPATRRRFEEAGLTPDDIRSAADLARLPVLRKDDLVALQQADPPFGGLLAVDLAQLRRVFQSPGPINEPEADVADYWRWAPALEAAGFRPGDIVLNAFSYHLTPAGAMFESGLRALGCVVLPGGIGSQEQQVEAMVRLGVTGYVGLPSYLKALLEKAEALGHDPRQWPLRVAFVTAEPLPPSLRQHLQGYGLTVRQGYGTAEAGNLGYECEQEAGWHLPEDALVQVCDINTGRPLPPGQTGEVVVTLFHEAYPLIRFGTGDLSALDPEPCPCGRSTPRLVGWQGRVGDAVKVRGMFLHPRQAAEVMARFPEVAAWQMVVTREAHVDYLTCRVVPTDPGADREALAERLARAIREALRFRAEIAFVDALPADAPPILDQRTWE